MLPWGLRYVKDHFHEMDLKRKKLLLWSNKLLSPLCYKYLNEYWNGNKMRNHKILVCDDEREIREIIKLLLNKTNYEVIEAVNGLSAVEIALKEKPDLIIMDVMMPGTDGIQATLKLKKDPVTWNIPVILLTALADSKAVLKAKDCRADQYLSKPFTKEELMSAISSVIFS